MQVDTAFVKNGRYPHF